MTAVAASGSEKQHRFRGPRSRDHSRQFPEARPRPTRVGVTAESRDAGGSEVGVVAVVEARSSVIEAVAVCRPGDPARVRGFGSGGCQPLIVAKEAMLARHN